MSQPQTLEKRLVGILAISLGVMVLLLGAGILPSDLDPQKVPRAVVYLGGIIFIAGGALLLLQRLSALSHILGFAIYGAFAGVFWWIALSAPSELFDKNSLLLSDKWDVRTARILFGTVAVLATTILIYATTKLLRRNA